MSKHDTDWQETWQNTRWERTCNGKRCMVENLGAANDWRSWVQARPSDDKLTSIGFFDTGRGAKRGATMAARSMRYADPKPAWGHNQRMTPRAVQAYLHQGQRRFLLPRDEGDGHEEVTIDPDSLGGNFNEGYVRVRLSDGTETTAPTSLLRVARS